MKRLASMAIILAFGNGAVLAGDVIAQRRALMHDDGIAAKKLFDMAKGSAPFDISVAQASLKNIGDRCRENAAAVSRRQQDWRRNCGSAGDMGKQSRFQCAVREIQQECRRGDRTNER